MGKDQTSEDERASPQKARRKPLTIDLPVAEVGRKAGEARATSEASSVAAATVSAIPVETVKVDAPPPTPAPDKAATAASQHSAPVDPVIPSAFATGKAESNASLKAAKPQKSDAVSADRPWSLVPVFLAALGGGLIVAVVIVILALAGYFSPAGGTKAADIAAEVAALKGEIADLKQAPDGLTPLKDQVAALQKAVDELAGRAPSAASDPAALKEVQDRLAALESAGAATGSAPDLESRVTALAQDAAALKSAAPPDTTSLQSAVAKLRQDLDALAARVDAAPSEERIAAIETKLDQTSHEIGSAAALAPAVAADALAAALDSGRPFQAELAALKNLGADAQAVDALSAEAAAGLPTLAQLRSDFDTTMQSVALSTPVAENTGTIDRLLQSARGLVEVRPAHPTAGSDPGAIVARIRGALAAGDLKTALGEWNAVPDTIKAPTADWAKKAQTRLDADDLVARVRTAALSQLGAGK